MTLENIAELIIYPIEKILVLMGSISIGGVSILSLIVGSIVLGMIFNFFIGQHSFLDTHKQTNKKGNSNGRAANSSGESGANDN